MIGQPERTINALIFRACTASGKEACEPCGSVDGPADRPGYGDARTSVVPMVQTVEENELISVKKGLVWPHASRLAAGSVQHASCGGSLRWASSDDRLSLMWKNEFYFLPALGATVNDAAVLQLSDSVFIVAIGTDRGISIVQVGIDTTGALLVSGNTEVAVDDPVMAVYYVQANTVVFCTSTSVVDAVVVTLADGFLGATCSSNRQTVGSVATRPLSLIAGLRTMTSRRSNYVASVWDPVEARCFVLSTSDVAMWSVRTIAQATDTFPSADVRVERTAACAVSGAVGVVVEGEQRPSVAAVVFPDGSRQRLSMENKRAWSLQKHISLRLAAARLPLPPGVHVRGVTRCVSAGRGLIVMYDESTWSVVVLVTNVPSFYARNSLVTGTSQRHEIQEVGCERNHRAASSMLEVATVIRCSEPATSLSIAIPEDVAEGSIGAANTVQPGRVAIYSALGVIMCIELNSEAEVFRCVISREAVLRSSQNISYIEQCLGEVMSASNLLQLLCRREVVAPRILKWLDSLLIPKFDGARVTMSAGAVAVHRIVVKAIRRANETAVASRMAPDLFVRELRRRSEELEALHAVLTGVLEKRVCIGDFGSVPSARWEVSGSLSLIMATVAGAVTADHSSDRERIARVLQAEFINEHLRGMHRCAVALWLLSVAASHDITLAWPRLSKGLTEVPIDSLTGPSVASLASVVWGFGGASDGFASADNSATRNFQHVQFQWCDQLLSTSSVGAVKALNDRSSLLPAYVSLRAQMRALVLKGDAAACLQFAEENVAALVNESLLATVSEELEAAFPLQHSRLQLLLAVCRRVPEQSEAALQQVLQILEDVPPEPPQALMNVLSLVLQSSLTSAHLNATLINWLASHELEDPRIKLFASIASRYALQLPAPTSPTAEFFLHWVSRDRGDVTAAAQGFSKLAKTSSPLSVAGRVVAILLALETDPSEADRLTLFTLALQDNLHETLKAVRSTPVADDAQFQRDLERTLRALQTTHMEERQLFNLAGQYQALGGCKTQLNLLRVHPEARESLTTDVVHVLLEYNAKTVGCAREACTMVLREYYGTYAAGLPLHPFVEFLAVHGESAEAIAKTLRDSSVPSEDVFEAFVSLLEERGDNPTLPQTETLAALWWLCQDLPESRRQAGTALVLEHISSVAEGDDTTAALSALGECDAMATNPRRQQLSASGARSRVGNCEVRRE